MTWQLLVVISSAIHSVSTILSRIFLSGKKNDPVMFSSLYQIICAVILTVIGITLGQFQVTEILPFWFNIVLIAVLYGFGSVFMFTSLKTIEASKFTVIFSSQAFFTIIGAYFFLGERLELYNLAGVAALFVSVVLVSFTPDSINFDKDEILALLTALLFGFARVNDKFLLNQGMNFYFLLLLGFILPGILILIFYKNGFKKVGDYVNIKKGGFILFISLVYALGTLTFYSALSLGKSGQVTTASILGVVITEILAVVFLSERKNLGRKFLGCLFAIVGLLLVTM